MAINNFRLQSTSDNHVKVIVMVAINIVIIVSLSMFFGHEEDIGAVIFEIRPSYHEIMALLFK